MNLGILISIIFANADYHQPDGVNDTTQEGVTLNDQTDVLEHYKIHPKLPLSSAYKEHFTNPYAEEIRQNSNIKKEEDFAE